MIKGSEDGYHRKCILNTQAMVELGGIVAYSSQVYIKAIILISRMLNKTSTLCEHKQKNEI